MSNKNKNIYDILKLNGGKITEDNNNNIIIYQTDDVLTKIDVKLENETV